MILQQHKKAVDLKAKKELLKTVYDVYAEWVQRLPLACRKGCASCCTQSVAMSDLEGRVILDFCAAQGRREWLLAKLARTSVGKSRSLVTTNQFAEACLRQQEIDAEAPGSWDFTPCVFLENDVCTIYEVRPFGCRSFGSLVQCREKGAAEMAPIHLTVNTVFTQIIEHLSSDGGHWSFMTDILHSRVKDQNPVQSSHLPNARPVPGFLLQSHEVVLIRNLLQKICKGSSSLEHLADLIDNFMPME